jgi:hypothetical protein
MTAEGFYMACASSAPCLATDALRFVLKSGSRRRSLVRTELLIDCSKAAAEVYPTIGILMGIKMVHAIRTYLHEVAGGIPDGLPRPGQAGTIERLRLVLPKGSTWPDVEGMQEMSNAITTILATG